MAGKVAARIALFVVSAIPGAAGFFAGQPVLGGALLLVCEGLAAVGAFAGGLVGDLVQRRRSWLLDRMDAAVSRRLARFERAYRDKVLSDSRYSDAKGLTFTGFFTPELDDVYVDVKVAPGTPHTVRADLLAEVPADVAVRHQLGDFLDLPSPQILAVVGAPGGGKTTLLRHTAREACIRHRGRRRPIPVLLYLRDHVGQIVRNPDIELPVLIRMAVTRHGLQDPGSWFETRLRAGRCLVLLDGLDEVARAEDRLVIAEWVDAQVMRYAKNDFVITSRPAGYRAATIANAKVLQVCNFNSEQVRRFVRRWYLALERETTRADADTVAARAGEAASDLLERLDRAPALYELTVNPLLLTMIANVHQHRNALPGSRVDLYGEICQSMLWRRQQAKKLHEEVSGEKKEVLLRRLAFTMMEREVRDLPRADVLTLIRPALRRVSRDLTPDDFLADVSSNGLIVERESGQYSFAHLTFQEYLAASHIRDRGLTKVLAEQVDNVWWRETTLLYAARSDADEIVLACLDSASVPALSLAFDCVDQSSELDPDLRDQLEALLATAFSPDTSAEQRRLLTAVVVIRHLRQLVRTDTGLVCARPVTNRIYRLFRQDTGRPEPDAFDPSRPDEHLVVGVHASDALAFAEWASAITENKTVYRPVTRMQLENGDVRRAVAASAPNAKACSIWLDPSADEPFFWSSSARTAQYAISGTELIQQVRFDIADRMPDLVRLLLLRTIIEVHDMAGELETAIKTARERAENAARTSDVGADVAETRVRSAMRAGPDRLHEALARAAHIVGFPELQGPFIDILRIVETIANGRGHDRAEALSLGMEIADELVAALDPTLATVLAFDQSVDAPLGPDQIMGTVLSQSFGHLLRGHAKITSVERAFADEFVRHARIADAGYAASPSAMENKVSKACWAVIDRLRREHEDPRTTWTGRVAAALAALAAPIVGRQAPMTEQAAIVLRFAALCLAGEPVVQQDPELGLALREIAAGTMVMRARADGELPPTETILLAVP
ncbi:NACHT domain-containing protein [Kutzneria sp. NPDC052558]|uniref:NACHT domain-containing protein n=1 Tax=Kutzneria sp. NPDC052558 TaxID=3364121 RepID=UPI0037CB33E3